MPYWTLDGEDPPTIQLRQVGPNAFQLLNGFRFARREGAVPPVITVPPHDPSRPPSRGNATDLASVPWFLWWFISSHGRQTPAALLHDHLVIEPQFDRRLADLVFREALAESGVSWVRRWVMWAGVTLATRAKVDRLRLLLLVGHLLASFILVGLWLFGRQVSGWWAVSSMLAGAAWGVLWPLMVMSFVLLGPATFAVGVSVSVVYIIELAGNVIGALRGRAFELPRPVPYRSNRWR